MSNEVTVTTPRPIIPTDYDSAWRMATAISKSGLAPKGITTPEAIFTAMQLGAEVGLTPMSALQNIAVVNGRPTIWGDAQLALVRASGQLVDFEETLTGEGETMTAKCVATRQGYKTPSIGEFSVADARVAGLWGKDGPWRTNPKRMLKMRARAFALRDGFTDVLKGIYSTEELRDAPLIDVTAGNNTADDLNKEFITDGKVETAGENIVTLTKEHDPKVAEGEVLPPAKVDKPKPAKAAPATDDTPEGRKKFAEKLLDDLNAADPDDRDGMMAKAGGQNLILALNKDGQYDLVKLIKKAAGI